MQRRNFIKLLGLGAAGLILEEPVKKLWFVPSSAPVGSRIERLTEPAVNTSMSKPEVLEALFKRCRSQQDLDALVKAARLAETMFHGKEREELLYALNRNSSPPRYEYEEGIVSTATLVIA